MRNQECHNDEIMAEIAAVSGSLPHLQARTMGIDAGTLVIGASSHRSMEMSRSRLPRLITLKSSRPVTPQRAHWTLRKDRDGLTVGKAVVLPKPLFHSVEQFSVS